MSKKNFNAEGRAQPSKDELVKFWGWIKTGDACVEAAAAFLDRYPQAIHIPLTETDDWSTEAGIFPLHYAAKNGDNFHPAMVELLIARGADVNGRDPWKRTPLHVHVSWDPRKGGKCLQLLLDKGADPNARDCEGKTPLLRVAEQTQDSAQAVALMNAGADPNIADSRGSAPLRAVMANLVRGNDVIGVDRPLNIKAACAAALIERGAQANAAAVDGSSAVSFAKEYAFESGYVRDACDAVIEKGRADNAEGVAQEATQLAATGTRRKTKTLPRIRFRSS